MFTSTRFIGKISCKTLRTLFAFCAGLHPSAISLLFFMGPVSALELPLTFKLKPSHSVREFHTRYYAAARIRNTNQNWDQNTNYQIYNAIY